MIRIQDQCHWRKLRDIFLECNKQKHKTNRTRTMLSPSYRQRMTKICHAIAYGLESITVSDRTWASKLAQHNRVAARMLRQAERKRDNPDMTEGDLDSFLNDLDIGGTGFDRNGVSRFDSVDDIVDFFREDRPPDWRQRD